ncbi:MAG: hypothetical protein ACK4ME_01045 [Fimbriimonadales bacterium]
MMTQLTLWETGAAAAATARTHRERLEYKYRPFLQERLDWGEKVSYRANKSIPLLRLYRYKEAFAHTLVRELIQAHSAEKNLCVLDPFLGMGTTLFASTVLGIPSWGVDRLPVGVFIADTLLKMLSVEPSAIIDTYRRLLGDIDTFPEATAATDVAIMKVAFDPEILKRLLQWKTGILQLSTPMREIMMLLLLSILEPCSYTSKDGQFLRLRREKQPVFPDAALYERVLAAERDVQAVRALGWEPRAPAIPIVGDARALPPSPFSEKPNLVVTSPPYANRYDYTRSYSLELCFFFVENFEQLKLLRHSVLRSHIEAKVNPSERAPHHAVNELVQILQSRREQLNNPRIPDMITAYFVDMQQVLYNLSRVCADGATIYMVIDNVRFEGEMLPVDLILCDMAETYGLRTEAVWVARYKGNSSQQMGRYGRVPVRESILVWSKIS